MGGSRDLLTYGITGAATNIGLSTLSFFPQAKYIISRTITPASGGSLLIFGFSTLSGGALIPSNGYTIDGPAQFYLLASGASTTAHIVTNLTQGFNVTLGS